MKRKMAVDENGEEYDDNGERAIFFARGVLETVKKLRWSSEVIHCQGWMSYIVPLFIKAAYNDEPTFNDTNCLEFKDITVDSLSAYKDDFDFMEFCKLAIDNSDAVIEAEENANPELLAYAESKGLPILKYPGENYTEAYKEFYEKL